MKNVVEAAAVLGTALYFLFRVLSGFFVVNMSVSVSAVRGYKDEKDDWLAATISLKKADRRTVGIHDVLVGGRSPDGAWVEMTLTDTFTRWTFTKGSSTKGVTVGDRRSIVPDTPSASNPVLNLSPGEEVVLGSLGSVPRESPFLVEVAILAKATASTMWSEWKTSCVSLPSYPAKVVSGARPVNPTVSAAGAQTQT